MRRRSEWRLPGWRAGLPAVSPSRRKDRRQASGADILQTKTLGSYSTQNLVCIHYPPASLPVQLGTGLQHWPPKHLLSHLTARLPVSSSNIHCPGLISLAVTAWPALSNRREEEPCKENYLPLLLSLIHHFQLRQEAQEWPCVAQSSAWLQWW